MKTHQQDVVLEKSKLAELKGAMMRELACFLSKSRTNDDDSEAAILSYQRAGTAYFNHAEEFVGNSSLLGGHDSALWAQGFSEDCAEILRSIPAHYDLLREVFSKSPRLRNLPVDPGPTAFANMQRMTIRYLDRKVVDEIKEEFSRRNLPIYGFEKKEKDFMGRDKILSYVFGVSFIVILLLIALFKPDPTNFQYTVFRTVLALAGAGIGAVIPGFLQVESGKWLRAGGAIAIFVLVYFWNPAQLV